MQSGNGLILSYKKCEITQDDSPDVARALMPCGHVISIEGMTAFLRSLVTSAKYEIRCPGKDNVNKNCNREWDYSLCRKIGQLTQTEMEEFEAGLSRNLALHKLDANQCPTCKSFILKPEGQKSNKVRCELC